MLGSRDLLGRYFDNAATTPIDQRVVSEMLPYLQMEFGNANSIHGFGHRARAAVEVARERVADLIGAEDASQVIFTSGATESNNTVLRTFASGAVSPFEHSAVREPALRLGYEILENDGLEIRPPSSSLTLLSVMGVNNEIGSVWNPSDFSEFADYVHSDLTQAAGKIPFDLEGISFASLSGHKFYGPKGVGALYCEKNPPEPLLIGGEQEHGIRGGTLNVAGIVGMGVAAAIAAEEMDADALFASELRSIVLEGLEGLDLWRTNGGSYVSPYILSVSFLGLEGETIVVELDRAGYAISSGAACSSQSTEPSHVLKALKVEDEWSRGTVRISFGRFCTQESAEGLARTLRHAVENIRRMD